MSTLLIAILFCIACSVGPCTCDGGCDPTVAFYATLTKMLTLTNSQTVVYDKVYTNFGTAYDDKKGNFTAPTKGLYYFTTTLMSLHDEDLHVSLMKNNQQIGKGHASKGRAEVGSITAIVQLEEGDSVTVKHFGRNQKIYGYEYCSFAGYLISTGI